MKYHLDFSDAQVIVKDHGKREGLMLLYSEKEGMRQCAAGVTLRSSGHPAAEHGDARTQRNLDILQLGNKPYKRGRLACRLSPPAQKKNPACERGKRPLYYVFAASAIVAGRPVSSGEVSELAEGARLEIVYAPKAYPGFKSPPLRQS